MRQAHSLTGFTASPVMQLNYDIMTAETFDAPHVAHHIYGVPECVDMHVFCRAHICMVMFCCLASGSPFSTKAGKVEPYASNTQALTMNAEDSIFRESAAGSFDLVVEYALLGDTVKDGIFAWISVGVDTSKAIELNAVPSLTADGGVENASSGGGPGGMGGGGPDGGMRGPGELNGFAAGPAAASAGPTPGPPLASSASPQAVRSRSCSMLRTAALYLLRSCTTPTTRAWMHDAHHNSQWRSIGPPRYAQLVIWSALLQADSGNGASSRLLLRVPVLAGLGLGVGLGF